MLKTFNLSPLVLDVNGNTLIHLTLLKFPAFVERKGSPSKNDRELSPDENPLNQSFIEMQGNLLPSNMISLASATPHNQPMRDGQLYVEAK